MDKKQIKTLEAMGFSVEELPGKPIPRMNYWKKDGTPLGELLADPYHMQRYLSRGFTINPPKDEFRCETCEASFTSRIALEGHKRSHVKSKKEAINEFSR